MLILGLIEAALELVPSKITQHPSVITSAKIRKKPPETMLLDEALHAKAIQQLPDAEKRGRPDVAHRSLLVAMDSVLAREEQLEVFLHTFNGSIVEIQPGTRLPRRAARFVGLIEQLFANNRVPVTGQALLQIRPERLEAYLKQLKPSNIYLLSQHGTPTPPAEFAQTLTKDTNPVVLVGGFAHGEPAPTIKNLADHQVSLDTELLPTSTIVGMLIHSVENALNLAVTRFQQQK
jgi:rRNA small subunit pseudouridine methyltransferase Nep1